MKIVKFHCRVFATNSVVVIRLYSDLKTTKPLFTQRNNRIWNQFHFLGRHVIKIYARIVSYKRNVFFVAIYVIIAVIIAVVDVLAAVAAHLFVGLFVLFICSFIIGYIYCSWWERLNTVSLKHLQALLISIFLSLSSEKSGKISWFLNSK
jgi:hypothetical protein